MKKLMVFIVLLLAGTKILCAQDVENNTIVRETLDKMFEHLDKTKVPTGLLLDYAFDLVDFDRYDGSSLTDSNYVERTTFECLLRSIRSSAVGVKPFKDIDSIMEDMARGDDNVLNVGLMLFKYNYIREDALSGGLIRYENDCVYDSYGPDGEWKNPYAGKYVIGFSSYNCISLSAVTKFAFSSDFIFSNVGIAKMEFDAGDGRGYTPVSAGGTIQASYQEGTAELKMRVTLDSGDILVCHSQLICDPAGIKLQGTSSADSGKLDSPGRVENFYHTSGGQSISARASVFYAKTNSTLSVKRPFIIVEGFDPVDLMAVKEQFGISLASKSAVDYYDSGFTCARNYYEGLKQSGSGISDKYDIIYVDWMNSEADIRDNARLLVKIIDWVNAEKVDSGSDESNIVLGESMGGLVARYALRTMELEGRSHETSVYISHDSPHLGAHVPLGALYAIRGLMLYYYNAGPGVDILKMALKTDSAAYALRKYLYSVSARQMLVNYVDSSGAIDNRTHNEWQSELAAIGFPAGDAGNGIMNLAIVNGGVLDPLVKNPYVTVDGTVYTSGIADVFSGLLSGILSNLLGFRTNFWDLLPGKTTLSCHAEVNPYLKYGGKVFDMNIGYTKKILWLFNKYINIFSMTNYAPSYGLMYDGFPGSIYRYGSGKGLEGGGSNKWLGGYGYNVNLYDGQFMFIPTASALCYGNEKRSLSAEDYGRSFCSSLPEPLVEMPFHSVFLERDASLHISPLAGMYNWIEQYVSRSIEGPSAPASGDRYEVPDCPYSVTWSSSDPAVLAIDPSTGAVTVNGTGYVTIKAVYVVYGQECSLSKSVIVGFPELYITAYLDVGKGYVAEAKCVGDEEKLAKFIRSGSISYEWGLKSGTGPINWSISSSPVYETGLEKRGSGFTDVVYVRLVAENGTKGKAYSKMISAPSKPYYLTPKCFIVNKYGELYSYDPKTSQPHLIPEEEFPLKIIYKMYTHDTPDYSLPRKIVVNDMHVCYWTYLPQPDTSLWMTFTLCTDEELYDLLEQMKPHGDMERFVFWVSAYGYNDDLLHFTSIHLVYRPDITGDDFMPEGLPM